MSRPALRTPVGHAAALVAAVLSSVLLVSMAPRHGPSSAALVACATAACGAIAILERRTPRLGGRVVAAAITVVMATAVIMPPRTSNDLWSYGTYGRMVVAHDANPYTATPSDFPHDPLAKRVSPIWQHRSSVYGPAWVAVASLDAAIVGGSKLGNRLFFQLLAALAASVILLVIWRRTRSPAALAWLGLHPVFAAVAVNSGHADVLIGLAVLSAALLVTRGKGWIAGIVIGLAALIKITALLAVVGVVLWAWRARRVRLAVTTAVGAGATLFLAYLPLLGGAATVLTRSDHTVTPASPWNWLADLLLGHDAGRRVPNPLAFDSTLNVIFYLGLALVVVLALVVGWQAAAARDARRAVGATAASYTFGAAYSFPWYALWGLPSFADAAPTPLAWVVWLQAALMLTVLKLRVFSTDTLGDAVFRDALTYVLPLVLLVAFVVAGLRSRPDLDAAELSLTAASRD